MKYYQFDKNTLEINHTAIEAKMRGGIYHVPRDALQIEPKKQKSGYAVIAVLDENNCAVDTDYIKDFRGSTVYNKRTQESQVINELGEIDDDYTLKVPPSKYHTFGTDDWMLTDENAQQQLADELTSSITRIDDIAATVTQKWARFAEEYKEREAAALAFQDAGFTGDVSVYISSFASVAGKTNKEATLLILQQAQGLRALQEQLAVQRMRKYELKQPKLTIEQIQTLADEICSNIQALGDSYE